MTVKPAGQPGRIGKTSKEVKKSAESAYIFLAFSLPDNIRLLL